MERTRVEIGSQSIEMRSWLERFLFDAERQRQPVGSLSGGERARVALAKLLSVPSNLVILDEPTNDLDVETLAALEDLLTEWDGSAIVVTHDRWFLDRVATSVLVLPGDGRAVKLAGGSEHAIAFLAEEDAKTKAAVEAAKRAAQDEAKRASAPPPAAEKAAPKKKLSFAEQKEADALPARSEAAEARVAALEATLADPSLYKDRGAEVPALTASLDEARAEVAAAYARWEELEARRG
jgi:ATP-binding cassette subfamily F protein uup